VDASVLREILIGFGINADFLAGATHLRDLELDPGEVAVLELELERRLGVTVQLDRERDYTLDEVAELVDATTAA
jgi:hypothetical protein